jgi:hypothetical protein
VVPVLAAEAAHRPLDPDQRQAHDEQGHEIGNQKGTAAIRSRLRRKSQEVPKTYGIAGHGQHQAKP